MASNASPEANEIRRRGRRRLVGAIALVMLLVVFVPMVLDSEPRPARNEPATRIPPRDNAPPLPTPPPVAPAKAGAQTDSKAGPLTRLRAGPFATREEAEAALAKLKLSALDGKVVPLP